MSYCNSDHRQIETRVSLNPIMHIHKTPGAYFLQCDNCATSIQTVHIYKCDPFKIDFCHECAQKLTQYPMTIYLVIQTLQTKLDIDCARLILSFLT